MLDNYPKLSIYSKTICWVKVVVLLGEGSIHHRKTNHFLCCLDLNDKYKEIIDIKLPFIDIRFFHYSYDVWILCMVENTISVTHNVINSWNDDLKGVRVTSKVHFQPYLWIHWSDFDKLGLILKLRRPSVGLASPREPTSPSKASPRVQKGGLVPALLWNSKFFHYM